jgi:hypothetical protein
MGNEINKVLRFAGAFLLTVFTAFLLFVGTGIVFAPSEKLEFANIPVAKAIAVVSVALGTTIMVAFTHRLAKILPGILAYSTIGGLAMVFTGHLSNRPLLPVSRIEALVFTLLLGASCLLSMHFHGRRLTFVDRTGLLSFVGCLLWASVSKGNVLPMTCAVAALLIPFTVNRIHGNRGGNRGQTGRFLIILLAVACLA